MPHLKHIVARTGGNEVITKRTGRENSISSLPILYKVKSMLYKVENPAAKVKEIQSEAFELFKRKNEQYCNAFAKYGTVGVMIRMERR